MDEETKKKLIIALTGLLGIIILILLWLLRKCQGTPTTDTTTCGTGTHLDGDTCVPDSTGETTTCGTGTHLEGNVCVPDAPTNTGTCAICDMLNPTQAVQQENPLTAILPDSGSSLPPSHDGLLSSGGSNITSTCRSVQTIMIDGQPYDVCYHDYNSETTTCPKGTCTWKMV